MKESRWPKVKVKAAGGVRSLDGLIAVQEAGCARCRAIAIMEDAIERFGK
jgi:deoxyribose-phosphate aldolase